MPSFNLAALLLATVSTTGPDYPVHYLAISQSMPDDTISAYMHQVRAPNHSKQVVLALRGFEPKRLDALLGWLYRNGGDSLEGIKIEIHPPLFRDFNIEQVPALIGEGEDGVWRVAQGDATLDRLTKELDRTDPRTLGSVYPVAEPDLLAWVKDAASKLDLAKRLGEARERFTGGSTFEASLPVAENSTTYLVDPSIRVTRDVVSVDGQLLAKAGTYINPLDHLPLARIYLFFDASDQGQLNVVDEWVAESPHAQLISTRNIDDAHRALVSARYSRPVFDANALLIRRFALRAVPSKVQQRGTQLEVHVEVPRG